MDILKRMTTARSAAVTCSASRHAAEVGERLVEYGKLQLDPVAAREAGESIAAGDGAEFRALNLPRPTYIAPDPAAELDAAIDAAVDAAVCRRCGHDNDAHDRQYGCAEDGCDCETP